MATKKLDELNQSENIFNDDIMLVQHIDGAAEKFTGLQMKKFCTEGFTSDEETLNILNPSSNKPINSGAIGNAGFGVYKTAVCSSAADAEEKAIIIQDYIPVNGDVIGITFENGNTYGETTISNPTNPKIKINDSALFSICDSRGHAAGKGFCNSGDYIEFRIAGDKLIILNSDIRESVQGESGYTIYSNDFIEYTPKPVNISLPYTAPCNGFLTFSLRTSQTGLYYHYFNVNNVQLRKARFSGYTGIKFVETKMMFVNKGDVISFYENSNILDVEYTFTPLNNSL